jgi:hypothetical protein
VSLIACTMKRSFRRSLCNGEVEHVKFEERMREGGESPVINLKTPWRDGHYIREVELHYRSRPDFGGEAVAELWG